MKIKKLIAIGLVLSMLLSLSACANTQTQPKASQTSAETEKSSEQSGQQEETSSVAEEAKGVVFPLEEPVTFTVMNNYFSEDYKLADNPVMDVLSEMTNVSFEHTEVLRADSVEKANLLITGGEYPDCFLKLPDLDWASLGADGIVIPLEDLIREYAPNLTALLDERDGWDDLAEADGHIYVLSSVGKPGSAVGSSVLYYNKVWMDNLGLKEPTNMDELYTLLKAFKENDANGNGDPNDEIPLHLNMSHSWKNMQAYMTDGLHWYKTYMALMEDGEYSGKMVYYPRTEEFKENLLKYLIQWYQEGLIDQNMFTQTYEQSTSIGQTSNVYGMFWNSLPKQAAPEGHIHEYYFLTPFENGYFPVGSGFQKGGFAITDKCEHPEILVAWVDQLYSEEGGRLATLGVEGVSYELNDDGTYSAIDSNLKLSGNCAAPGYFPDLYYNKKKDADIQYQNYELYVKPAEVGVTLPIINNTEEETQRISDLESNITAYMENYVAELIVGEISLDDTWEDFQNTLLEMGVEELESLYQAGYDRENAK